MTAHFTALHSVCVHEAGHAAVARYYGHATHWKAFLAGDRDADGNLDTYWRGRIQFYGGRLGVCVERRIGLAGVLAEILHDNPEVDAYSVDDYLSSEVVEMSDSDWGLVGDYKIRDLDRPGFRRHLVAIIHGNKRGVYEQQQAVHG